MSVGLIGFAAVIGLILAGLPVAIAMGVVGYAGLLIIAGPDMAGYMVGRSAFHAVYPYTLSIVPLFIAMGVFAGHGGLSQALYDAVAKLVGHVRGGLAVATIGGCAMFGSVSGSAIATTATMGRVALPEMRKHGYSDRLSCATIAAGGTLGIIIPPSILFVIYGLATEQSIGKLFLSGVLPGILGMLLYIGAVIWIVRGKGIANGPAGPRHDWRQRLEALIGVWQVVVLFAVVLGGMYFGWFSPTEAAGVGAVGALGLAWISGRLDSLVLRNSAGEIAKTSGMIFMILIGAAIFNAFIELTGLTDGLIAEINNVNVNRWWIMFVIMAMYIVLGALMDELSMILLTITPVFQLITALNFDPIWFGVMLITVCEIGMITPPVGLNLFVIQGIAKVPLGVVVKGIGAFIVADLLRLLILSMLPWLATWLPSHMIQ